MRDAGGFLDISPYLPKLMLLTELNLLMLTSAFLGLGSPYLGLVFVLALCCMFIVCLCACAVTMEWESYGVLAYAYGTVR